MLAWLYDERRTWNRYYDDDDGGGGGRMPVGMPGGRLGGVDGDDVPPRPPPQLPPQQQSSIFLFDLNRDGRVTADEVVIGMAQRVSCLNGRPALWQVAIGLDRRRLLPERYLEACGECFVCMCLISWALTWWFNRHSLDHNPLKARVGYNNICVGFDAPPARYIAMPLQVLQAYLAVRYVSLDTTRAALEAREVSAGRRIKRWQLAFTRLANLCYGGFMVCFPVLLVVTPEVSAMWHSLLFFCMILVSFTVVAANFAEAHHVETPSKVWLALWALHSVLLLVVGVIDFAHFDPAQESPPVPWQLTAYLDWGWFLLLGLTVVFLPDSPPLRASWELA